MQKHVNELLDALVTRNKEKITALGNVKESTEGALEENRCTILKFTKDGSKPPD